VALSLAAPAPGESAAAEAAPARAGARLAAAGAAAMAAAGATAFDLPGPAAAVTLGGFALAAAAAIRGIGPDHPHMRFGAANAITLGRLAGAAVFAGLAFAPGALAAPEAAWAAAGLAALLLALDGADGMAARRQGLASAYGARFDLEADAATILALSGLALALGKAGPWVLALGLMRYAFVAAGAVRPWIAAPLPPSTRRKAVCVLQLAVLGALPAPALAPPVSSALAGVALVALAWSFAVDLRWLARRRGPRR